jgi:hypothetical protein
MPLELLGEGGATADYRPETPQPAKAKADYNPVTDRAITCGGALILKMPLRRGSEMESLTLRTLSNDVVIGLMGITLEK